MSGERVERRLAAILAADVAGYSRLMGRDEAGTLARLKGLRRELIDPAIAEHKGRIVKTTGDGLLVEFPSVVAAVACAVAVQQDMAGHNAGVAEDERIAFRVGINSGDVIVEEGDIHGDGVNVAARLEAMAEPGGICVSGLVHDQVQGRLDCAFIDLGEQQLKNIARPVRVYRVGPNGSAPAAAGPPLPEKPSIAVLPFQNMSGDPEQEYFADGIVEEITTAIARLPWLFVIARNSSFTYKGKAVDVKQVARELGVRYVLEGSVRKAGNRVRITGQLIDTASGAHIWADRFDGALDDIFELQDEVASSVAGAIEPRLRQSEIERASRKPTESLDAYDLYLRARAQLRFTPESFAEACTLLERALAIDPFYAPAAGMIAYYRMLEIAQGWRSASEAERIGIVSLARRAIEMGTDDPEPLWMGGNTIAYLAGDHVGAANAIERALSLNPNSAAAYGGMGWLHCWAGRAVAAIEFFGRARRLSPRDPLGFIFAFGLAMAHLVAGSHREGLAFADQALLEQPRFVPLLRIKAALCAHLGRSAEAKETVHRLLELSPDRGITGGSANVALSPEVLAILTEGLRRAGLPEG